MATKSDVIDVLEFLAAAYNFKDIDEKLVRTWSATFQNVPRLWLARHAMKWVESEKWMPKISELRYRVFAEMESSYWSPPRHPRDEACMWLCFRKGCGPDELSIKELANLPPCEEVEYAAIV
jgi:hypothetical protein